MKIAIVGGGIAGLATAHRLAARHRVTLYEAADYVGGHTNTVDATVGGITYPVDTGFLVFNERTYPHLIALFETLGVPTAASDMSFSVSVGPHDFEWCGSDLASLFAQPSNALSPRFWSMLSDLMRFNRQATALARNPALSAEAAVPLGEWLLANRYGAPFRNGYLLPMAAAIWSCPASTMLAFPVGSFTRFCDNHGLLQIANRPRWFTVQGGARRRSGASSATTTPPGTVGWRSSPITAAKTSIMWSWPATATSRSHCSTRPTTTSAPSWAQCPISPIGLICIPTWP